MTDLNALYSKIEAGGVIVNIGGIDKATARKLDKLVKAGTLAKWRGYWFPVAGAQFGIGPLKTCWALPQVKERVSFSVDR